MKSWIRLFRIYQWPKNVLLFAVPFFAGRMGDISIILKTGVAFILFSFIATSVYVMNDISDLQSDKLHPTKRFRPLASGEISVRSALACAIVFAATGLFGSFYFFPLKYGITLIIYFAINIGYSFYLKHVVPLDVFCVSSGYILRIVGGGYASSISVSPWLFLTGFWVALYIGFSKRFSDICMVNDKVDKDGKMSLKGAYKHYGETFLLGAMIMSGASCLMTYGIYTLKHRENLVPTIIPASYGILRYFVLAASARAGDPLRIFIKDKQIMISSFIFLGTIAWLLYI